MLMSAGVGTFKWCWYWQNFFLNNVYVYSSKMLMTDTNTTYEPLWLIMVNNRGVSLERHNVREMVLNESKHQKEKWIIKVL